jgi:hypothetical protein
MTQGYTDPPRSSASGPIVAATVVAGLVVLVSAALGRRRERQRQRAADYPDSAPQYRLPQGRAGVDAGGYGGFLDTFPLGALMERGLQLRTDQTHVQRYSQDLLRRVGEGDIDTTFLISHRLPLEEAPTGYANFKEQQNDWTKGVLKPKQ